MMDLKHFPNYKLWYAMNILQSDKKRVTLIDMSKNFVPSRKMMCISCMPMMMGMCRVTLNTGWGEITLS